MPMPFEHTSGREDFPLEWHVICNRSPAERKKMATRMNMLKLVEEMRGHADFANRKHSTRHFTGLPLAIPSRKGAPPKRKRLISIMMHDMADIPHPVKISHVAAVTVSQNVQASL